MRQNTASQMVLEICTVEDRDNPCELANIRACLRWCTRGEITCDVATIFRECLQPRITFDTAYL